MYAKAASVSSISRLAAHGHLGEVALRLAAAPEVDSQAGDAHARQGARQQRQQAVVAAAVAGKTVQNQHAGVTVGGRALLWDVKHAVHVLTVHAE